MELSKKCESISPKLVTTFSKYPKKLKHKKEIKRRLNKKRNRTNCVVKAKDNFVQISMTCLDCLQKGKLVTLVFKVIDALIKFL